MRGPHEEQPPAPLRRRTGRRLRRGLVWLIGLLALALLILQLPPVRAALLARGLAAAAARYDLDIAASNLRYNPFTLVVSVDGIRVAVRRTPSDPIFEADRAVVSFAPSLLVGTVHIEDIVLTRPRVTLVRGRDSRLNLPEIGKTRGGGPTVRIDRVTLHDAAFGFEDRPRAIAVALGEAAVSLVSRPGVPATFNLRTSTAGTVRIGGWHSSLEQAEADGTLDGGIFRIRYGRVQADDTAVAFTGVVDATARGRGYDLDLQARGLLQSIAASLAPRPLAGSFDFRGTLSGPLDAPRIAGRVTSPDLAIDALAPAAMRATIDYSRGGMRLDPLELQAPWGRLAARGSVLVPRTATNDLHVTFSNLDADVVAALDLLEPAYTPATLLAGSTRLRWRDGTDRHLAAEGTIRLAATARRGRVPLGGTIAFETSGAGWRLRHQVALDTFSLDGTIGGSSVEAPFSRMPIAGATHVRTSSLAGVERVLRAWGFADAAGALETLDGAADVSVSVSGRLGAPEILADATIPTFTFWKLPGRQARARVLIRPGGQQFEAVAMELGGVELTTDRLIRGQDGSLEGRVHVVSPNPEAWLVRFAPSWAGMARGAIDAVGQVGGTLTHPRFEGEVSARDVSAAGQDIRALTTWLRVSRDRLEFDRLEGQQDEGVLHASGTVVFDTSRLDVRGTAERFHLSPCNGPREPGTCAWTLPLSGIVTGSWELTDLLDAPSGQAQLDIADARWSGIAAGSTHAEARFDDGRTTLAVAAPDLRTTTTGTIDLAEAGLPFDVEVRAAGADIADVLGRFGVAAKGLAIQGQVSGRGHITGTLREARQSHVDALIDPATLIVRRAEAAEARPVTLSLEAPARVRLGPEEIGAEGLQLRLGGSTLSATGVLSRAPGSRASVHLTGAATDIVETITALGLAPVTAGSGTIVADVTLTGSPAAPTIEATLEVTDGAFTVAGEQVSGLNVRAALNNGMLTVGRARASWRDTTADGSVAVPLAWLTRDLPWWPAGWQQTEPPLARATSLVVISASPAALLADRVPRGVPAGGQLDVEIALAADGPGWDHVSGDLRVTSASLTVANALITQRDQGHATFMHGRVFIAPWRLQGSGTNLSIQGAVDITPGNSAVDLQVKGPIGLAALRPLTSFDLAGAVTMDLRAAGSATAPVVNGSIDLRDLAMRIRVPRLVVADTRGLVTFDNGVAHFNDVTATANGAPVLVRGTYDLTGARAPDVAVTAAAVPLQIVPAGPRIEADVDVSYTRDAAGPVLQGRVDILPQPYRGSILAIQSVISQVQEQYLTRTGGRRRRGPASPPTRLDLAIVLRDDLVVDSNVGQVELEADLRVAGTVQEPVLLGTVSTLPGGVLRAGGRTYRIERGVVAFENPRETTPVLDLIADTHIGAYDITMNVNGTFDALRTSLRSDPPLAESDLRSLLVTGRLVSDTGARRDLVDEQRVIESLSSDIFGFAAKAIGLDTVSIGVPDFELIAGGIDASTSLNVTKSFSRQVEIIFSQDLQDDTYSWVAIYRPRRSTSFRAISRETRDAAVEVRQEHNFGGGVPPRAPAPPERRVQPEVRQVLFFGPHGVPDEVLLDEVALKPGHRFDPWEWQADRDRLAAFYSARGYRQARIRPTRTPTSGGMRLEYEIVQGPRTTLTIDGHKFPEEVRRQFDEVWRDALTLEFLTEDLEEVARRHLIDDGYLRPQVRVTTVVDNADARALLMTIRPGLHVERRQVLFTGNTAVSAEDLEHAIATADAARRIWYDADNVVPIVQAAYRARGYLETAVEAGPVRLTDGRAELPVAIAEGRLFRITRIEFTGARAMSPSQLTAATGLHVGDPLNFAAIRDARQRLQSLYISRGFGQVEVRSQARVDRPTASLAPLFTIHEGVRREIADLQIRGNLNTRTKTISDFANLQRGTPVTPALVSDLQKRLYDMGVFTSVAVDFKPATRVPGSAAGAGTAVTEEPVVAVVTVGEAPRYSMRYGLQFTRTREATGTEVTYGPGAGADFRDRDFLHRAIAAGVGLRYDRNNQSVQGLLSMQRTYGADVRSNLFVTRRREHSTSSPDFSIQDNTTSVTAEQRKRLSRYLELAWALAYDDRQLSVRRTENNAEVLGFAGNTVGPRFAAAWDSRDNPFDATRGWFHSSAVDFGIRALGSDLTYTRYLLQHFQFVPVGKLILASGLRFGTLYAFDDPNSAHPVSLDLLFTAGGSHSVRGYAEDSLGPPAIANLRLGNRDMLVLNQELRFPLWRWFRGVAFIDAGNTFPRLSDVSFADLRVGAGAGLRLATPVGLFRFDVGYPLNPRPEDTTRVYFSVGQAF